MIELLNLMCLAVLLGFSATLGCGLGLEAFHRWNKLVRRVMTKLFSKGGAK